MAAFGLPALALAFTVRQESHVVVAFDQEVIRVATDVTRAAGLTHGLVLVQEVTKPVVVYALATVVVVRVWRVHRLPTRALWAFTTTMVTWTLGALAKLVVRRTRPVVVDPVSHASGYSFPSGHALNATTAAATLLILLRPLLSPTSRRAGVALGAALVIVVAADRVLLGVHFPSDVVAGVLLGLALTLSSWIGFGGAVAVAAAAEPPDLGHPR